MPTLAQIATKFGAVAGDRDFYADCPLCSQPVIWATLDDAGLAVGNECDCPRQSVLSAVNVSVADIAAVPPFVEQQEDGKPAKAKPNITADVVRYIEDRYELAVTHDGVAIAIPRSGNSRAAVEVRSLRKGLSAALWADQGITAGQQSISTALEIAAGTAAAGTRYPVGIRSMVRGDELFIDLGGADGRTVRVTADGWSVEDPGEGHPVFRRPGHQVPLPEPVRGGSMDQLRALLHMDAEDDRWALLRGWLVAVLFDDIPRPLLWCVGPQGSGKSTAARMVMSVVEPQATLGSPPGRSERDDSVVARGSFLVSYDNISTISQATSDWLCRLVTGASDNRRALYSDDDVITGSYRRSGVATSIVMPQGLRSDAVERIVQVPFERMPNTERASEVDIWSGFSQAHPAILGALLDDVSRALRHRAAAGQRKGVERPRMADYGNILLSLDIAYGSDGKPDGFLGSYFGRVNASLADRALDDPLALAVLKMVHGTADKYWVGTPATLLDRVNEAAGLDDRNTPKWWPTSPRGMSGALDRAGESLLHAGVQVGKKRTSKRRLITLTAVADLSETLDERYEMTPAEKSMAQQSDGPIRIIPNDKPGV